MDVRGSAPFLDRPQHEPDDDAADDREHESAEEAFHPAEAEGVREPAPDDPTDHADHDGREAALHRACPHEPARDGAREKPEEDPADEVHCPSVPPTRPTSWPDASRARTRG